MSEASGDGERVGEDMASDAGPGPAVKQDRVVNAAGIRLLEDGRLSYGRGEKFVLLLVDGIERGDAWKAAGGVNRGSSGESLRLLEGNAAFKTRLGMLEAEKASVYALGPHGEAMWAAKQAFRAARLADDTASTLRSAELIAKIADKLAPSENSNPAGSTGGSDRPVGRPPSEAKATKLDMTGIRAKLKAAGAPAPAPVGDEG